jgi:hypothetical protein
MIFLIKLAIGLVIFVLILGFAQTWAVENSNNGKLFNSSAAPSVKLDGFYKGSVNLPVKVTWLGKKFTSASSTGINVFDDGAGGQSEKYSFTTIMGLNGSSTVLYIDYDQPDNPFWVRPILDELVEPTPGQFLGKLTVRIIPGYPYSLGFFRLEK